jgi:hypothetical protein
MRVSTGDLRNGYAKRFAGGMFSVGIHCVANQRAGSA